MDRPRDAPAGHRIARPWGTAALAAMVLLAVLAVLWSRLALDGWDPSARIVAGDVYVDRAGLIAPIRVTPRSFGYDGQFFYRLALDPLATRERAFGVKLDNRAGRIGRILYPVLVWAASLGRARLVPWMLIAVNLAAMFALAWTAISLARWRGLPAWCGLPLAAFPGFLMSVDRDTAEVTASCFGLLALSTFLRGRAWAAAGFGVAAVLTRESTLFYLAGFGLVRAASALRRLRWSRELPALLAPLVAFLVWQVALLRITGGGSLLASTGGNDLGVPLRGIGRFLASCLAGLARERDHPIAYAFERYRLVAGLFCLVMVALPSLALGATPPGLALSWLLYAALVACFTTAVWDDPWGYLRVFADCYVVGATLLLMSARRVLIAIQLACAVPVWTLTAWLVLR